MRGRGEGWFLVWLVIGAGFLLGVLTGFTIGIFILPVVALLTFFVATRRTSTTGITGLVSGLGVPLLYIAFLNRHGPGNICRQYANGGESCTQEWSPWPWLAVGAVFVIGGAVLFVQQHRHRSPARR